MISISHRTLSLLLIIFLLVSSPCLAQDKYLPCIGIIHIHSYVSEQGIYPLRKIVSLAKDKGIKILVFSDSFIRRWEYGLPVLSNIFKVFREERSVVKYGIKRYLEDFVKIREEFPEMLILEGTEVAPFYWWSGNHFKKNLTLNDWNRHLLVFALRRYQDYAYLPVVSHRYFLPRLKDILPSLIPISLIIWGIFIFQKTKQGKLAGIILSAAGILFLLNFFPFSVSKYNPYQGQKGFLPHQDLINYVQKKEGLIFWAHPKVTESVSSGKIFKINFYTPSYPESLILTSGYTGFGVDREFNLVLPGSEWDKALMGYCEGKRSQPVWVISEADYRGYGNLDSIQNIFFLSEFNSESVYEAIRKGRFYIRYYSENKNISLHDFHIEDSLNPQQKFAFIGEEIKIKGKPKLYFKGTLISNPPENLTIEIIRNGEIINKFMFNNEREFNLEFQDDSLQVSDRKSYYRLNLFCSNEIILATNPIFVEVQQQDG